MCQCFGNRKYRLPGTSGTLLLLLSNHGSIHHATTCSIASPCSRYGRKDTEYPPLTSVAIPLILMIRPLSKG